MQRLIPNSNAPLLVSVSTGLKHTTISGITFSRRSALKNNASWAQMEGTDVIQVLYATNRKANDRSTTISISRVVIEDMFK